MSDEIMRTGANPDEPLPSRPVNLPAEVHNPDITENLLNAQLAECLSILRDAGLLYRTAGEMHGNFAQHAVELMKASTEMASAIARLQNGEPPRPELVQRVIVERIAQGEGGAQNPKND